MKLEHTANTYIKFVPASAFLFLVVVLTLYALPRAEFSIGTDPSYWGAFGDFVGGILNPLFGILTLIGLALTISLQKEILEVQKQELADTRKELERSTKALEIQNRTMLLQNFEGTFFQMLRKQSELLERIEFDSFGSIGRANGINAAVNFARAMKQLVEQMQNPNGAYDYLYKKNSISLGPYFRNLFHTFKLIDDSLHLSEDEKIKYSSLARAQLTSAELALIFYNCSTDWGQGFRPYVIKYRILKHIDNSFLFNSEWIDDPNFYPPDTYLARN